MLGLSALISTPGIVCLPRQAKHETVRLASLKGKHIPRLIGWNSTECWPPRNIASFVDVQPIALLILILGQKWRQSFVAGPRVDYEPKRRSANEDLISNLRASKFNSLAIRYDGAQMSVIDAASNWDQEPNCDEIEVVISSELRIRGYPRADCSRLLRSARHTRQRVARLKVRLGSCSTSWDYSSFPASGHVPRVGSSRSWDLGAMSVCIRGERAIH